MRKACKATTIDVASLAMHGIIALRSDSDTIHLQKGIKLRCACRTETKRERAQRKSNIQTDNYMQPSLVVTVVDC